MTEDEHNHPPSWNKLREISDILNRFSVAMTKLPSGNTDIDTRAYNPYSKVNTKRTNARLPQEFIDWCNENHKDMGFKSRELMLGACISFALDNPDSMLAHAQEAQMATLGHNMNLDERESIEPNTDTPGSDEKNIESTTANTNSNGSENSQDGEDTRNTNQDRYSTDDDIEIDNEEMKKDLGLDND